MSLLSTLVACSAELRTAYDAALTAGRIDIAAEIERMAAKVSALVGAVVTSRPLKDSHDAAS